MKYFENCYFLEEFEQEEENQEQKILTIQLEGGLCNYLRVLFSYYEYARFINSELNVIWLKTESCPGYFLDYFEPIPHVNFITNIEDIGENTNIYYRGYGCMANFPPMYKKLKLRPFIKNEILNKINKLEKNYISVHVRRTDHSNLAKRENYFTNDDDFYNYINKFDINKNIYIATDNEITYNCFKKKYLNRIKFNYHKVNQGSFRQTSLHDAIIDLYMCVYADDFMGSGYSSFSELIKKLRKLQN